ncbi:MAG: hypothetical protein RLZZ175_1579 [Bacteroidota bacterium]|jgi:short-subunit dehydrogenase
MNNSIVVTGGSKGIGKAIIIKFLSNGFDVVTCARDSKYLEVLKNEISPLETKGNLYFTTADLSKKEEVVIFFDFVKSKISQIDVLVNNTGVFQPGQINSEEDGVLENMINTNLYSAYYLTRLAIPEMVQRKAGYIFNMCSTASIMPYINGGSYCISKHALMGFSKVLREEMKEHNIKVTSILPGATLTASWEGVELPAERFMKPEDVADAIWGAYNLSANSVIEELLIRPQLGDL